MSLFLIPAHSRGGLVSFPLMEKAPKDQDRIYENNYRKIVA